jgi:hypothetical protein
MICSTKNPAVGRYVVRMLIVAAMCVLFSVVTALVFRLLHPRGAFSYLLAVLPSLPIMGALVYTGVYLAEEKDEFQRNLLVQSLLGGTGGILALVTAWGYMEDFAHIPHLDLIWVYPLFWLFAVISYMFVKARYR